MTREERTFTQMVWRHYRTYGRHTLPWRTKITPYRILVSEVMLQQTQVDRVLPKYQLFMRTFPSASRLQSAPLHAVLGLWQGLGYNRRAQYLHAAARTVTQDYRGRFPKSYDALRTLPGIGPYTAGAIMAFAYNEPVALIETNIRSVYLHHFFKDYTDVSDREVLTLVERTLDRENPREWYWALMDYGAVLKKQEGNPNLRSKHYVRQTPFKDSDRQLRGLLVKLLIENKRATRTFFHTKLPFDALRIDTQLVRLEAEGLIRRERDTYFIM